MIKCEKFIINRKVLRYVTYTDDILSICLDDGKIIEIKYDIPAKLMKDYSKLCEVL